VLLAQCSGALDVAALDVLNLIMSAGCLSSRINQALEEDYRRDNLRRIYRRLADALQRNKVFVP
jgi:hypothetical protein